MSDNQSNKQIYELKDKLKKAEEKSLFLEERLKIIEKRSNDIEGISLKLIENQKKFKNYIEHSTIAILGVDNKGKLLYINPAVLKLTGYEKHELLKKNILKLLTSVNKHDEIKTIFDFKTFKKKSYETKIIKKDNTQIFVQVDAIKISDNEIVAFCKDITFEKLAASREILFQTLYDNAPDGIFLININSEITNCNKAYRKQLGLDNDEIINKTFYDFYTTEIVNTELLKNINDSLLIEFEANQLQRGDETLPVWIKIIPLNDNDNNFSGSVAFVRDIKKIKNAKLERLENYNEIAAQNEEIATSNEELKKINNALYDSNNKLEESLKVIEKINIELEESQNLYSIIANNTGDFIATLSFTLNPKFVFVSPSHSKLGYSSLDLVGKSAFSFIHKKDLPRLLKLLQNFLLKRAKNLINFDTPEKILTVELRFRASDGKWIDIESVVSFSKSYILFTSRDISVRKEREEIIKEQNAEIKFSNEKLKALNKDLLKSEETYKNIYNSTYEGIFIHDANTGEILDINSAVTEMYGYTKQEIIELNVNDLSSGIEPYNQENAINNVSRAAKGEIVTFTWQAKNKNGRFFWTLITLKKAKIAGVERVVAVVKDIDEIKVIQENLEESEGKFKQLSELSPTGILIYQDDKIVYGNESMASITGHSIEELLNMHFWEVVHPDMREMVTERGRKRQSGEKLQPRYEMKLITKSGKSRWIDFNGANIIYNNKPAAIGNVIDITDLKKIIDDLEMAKEKAIESDMLKSAFLANMSHEIRTPMNGILGFAQLLDDEELDFNKRKEFLNIINTSGQQLLNIINDILDISKIESGQINIFKENVNIPDLLNEVLEMFENQTAEKKDFVDFKMDLSVKLETIEICTDVFRVKQILINLISNAFKFTNKGQIIFGYKVINDFVKFYVRDTGIGIPKDKQHIIFSRFGQVESEYTKVKSGTGIGLAISKGLTELLGGEMYFESEENIGTTFYFTIPNIKE